MSANRVPKTSTRRSRALLRYDKDDTRLQVLFRVDFTTSDPPTPITPAYEARIDREGIKGRAVPKRNFDPRQVQVCYAIDGSAVTRTVFIPYRPIDKGHKRHLKELLDFKKSPNSRVRTLLYLGESS